VTILDSTPQDISKLQANVAATKAAKVVLEQELIECERQIMLLERKLELEKETQAAYNQEDETGNIIKSMKREIHKMELRHVALLQEQEDLVVEVERCISKRESISMKGKTMPKKAETSADRKKGVNDMKGKIKDLESEALRYKKQILQLESDREDIGQRLDALGQQRKQLQAAEETAQITLNQVRAARRLSAGARTSHFL
jgi:chromosome segregation ATPase